MQARADAAGAGLRPHWKTHKCAEIARRQIERGAIGGTVAKAGEAEAFFAAGFRDLLVATPVVDPRKIERLVAARDGGGGAAGGGRRLTVLIESRVGLKRWAAARVGANPVRVVIEIDGGMGRTGVSEPEAALELVRGIDAAPGLEFVGFLTHAGHAYGAESTAQLEEIRASEPAALLRAVEWLATGPPILSIGSTPTLAAGDVPPGVTEWRPGNYCFYDGIQLDLGVAREEQVALTVLATVTARPTAGRVVLDCGAKTMSVDRGKRGLRGFGEIVGSEATTGAPIHLGGLSEEHAIVPVRSSVELEVGDRVRVIPNHACVTVNLHDEFVVTRGDHVVGRWPILARGRVK